MSKKKISFNWCMNNCEIRKQKIELGKPCSLPGTSRLSLKSYQLIDTSRVCNQTDSLVRTIKRVTSCY